MKLNIVKETTVSQFYSFDNQMTYTPYPGILLQHQ